MECLLPFMAGRTSGQKARKFLGSANTSRRSSLDRKFLGIIFKTNLQDVFLEGKPICRRKTNKRSSMHERLSGGLQQVFYRGKILKKGIERGTTVMKFCYKRFSVSFFRGHSRSSMGQRSARKSFRGLLRTRDLPGAFYKQITFKRVFIERRISRVGI